LKNSKGTKPCGLSFSTLETSVPFTHGNFRKSTPEFLVEWKAPMVCSYLVQRIILLVGNYNHALVWKMADRFPEPSKSDTDMKTNSVIEWKKSLLNSIITKYRDLSVSRRLQLICLPLTNHVILLNLVQKLLIFRWVVRH